MDLRSRLEEKRKALKPCTTLLTTVEGRKFEVQGNESVEVEKGLPYVVDSKPDMQIAPIVPGLFLSSQDPTISLEMLSQREIKHILSLGIEPGTKFDGIRYHFVEMLDLPETDISEIAISCCRIIHRHLAENVLVHCNAGVSRSASIVISYLMIAKKLSYDAALEKVKAERSCVRPNEGFVRQLRRLQFREIDL